MIDGKVMRRQGRPSDALPAAILPSALQALLAALDKSLAVIDFQPGRYRHHRQNPELLHRFGYRLEEVVGKHHRQFCDRVYQKTPTLARSWLRGHQVRTLHAPWPSQGRRYGREATYNPFFNHEGKVVKNHQAGERHHGAGEKSISTREAAQKACAIASETVASAAKGREVIDKVLETSHINTSRS